MISKLWDEENCKVTVAIVFNPFTNEFIQTEKDAKSYIGMLTLALRKAGYIIASANENENPKNEFLMMIKSTMIDTVS